MCGDVEINVEEKKRYELTILNQQVQSIAIDGMHVYLRSRIKSSNTEMLNEKYM